MKDIAPNNNYAPAPPLKIMNCSIKTIKSSKKANEIIAISIF